MKEYINIRQLPGALRRDAKRIENGIKKALEKTAVKAVRPIRQRVPVAFGELRESIQGYSRGKNDVPVTSADAPHAGVVEEGSRPHEPDFDALLAWVKLRGMQGLTSRGKLRGRFRKDQGPTTPRQARRVSSMLKDLEVRGNSRRGYGRHLPIDAAEEVARRIASGIKKHGTPPHWYVKKSLPEIKAIMAKEIEYAVKGRKQAAFGNANTVIAPSPVP